MSSHTRKEVIVTLVSRLSWVGLKLNGCLGQEEEWESSWSPVCEETLAPLLTALRPGQHDG